MYSNVVPHCPPSSIRMIKSAKFCKIMQYFADLIICIEDGGHQPSAEGKKVEVKGAQRFIYILMWCIAKNCSYLGVRGTFFHFEWPGKESGCVERRVNYNIYLRCQSICARIHLLPKTLQIYYKSVALRSFFVSKTRTRFDLPSNTWGCIASFHLFMLESKDPNIINQIGFYGSL